MGSINLLGPLGGPSAASHASKAECFYTVSLIYFTESFYETYSNASVTTVRYRRILITLHVLREASQHVVFREVDFYVVGLDHFLI